MTELHDIAVQLSDSVMRFDSRLLSLSPSELRSSIRIGDSMPVSANEALVRRAIEAIWNRGDLDLADELFAPGYVNHGGLIGDLVLGPEAVKVSAAMYRLAFPSLQISVEEMTTIEDIVLLRWTARSCADLLGDSAVPTDQKLLTGITRGRIADGKIVESWTEWDRSACWAG
jgi:hypothetical protein